MSGKNQWTVWGKCFNPKTPETPTEASIPFSSDGQSVTMTGGNKVHSGTPIDANLAIYFINKFYSNYKIQVTEPIKNYKESGSRDVDALMDIYDKSANIHECIANMAYGMTLDKDMLLKILSQPKCEGVRFYLCAREIASNQLHLSLVAVGVDRGGYDLHYNLKETQKQSLIMPSVHDIKTQSLTGEYTTPPPPTGADIKEYMADPKGTFTPLRAVDVDPHYALLKLARNNQQEGNPPDNDVLFTF